MNGRILACAVVCASLLTGTLYAQPPQRRAAQEQLIMATKAIDMRLSAAARDVQLKAAEVPVLKPTEVQVVPLPGNPAKQIEVASDQQRNELLNKVKQYAQEKKESQNRYYMLALIFAISGVALALLSTVFGFLGWAKTAGIISLVVAAVVGFPKAYPIPALADFYSSLSVQALALQTDCELKSPMAVDDYNSSVAQLKALILYEAQNRPGFGEVKVPTDDLAKQMQELRTLASSGSK